MTAIGLELRLEAQVGGLHAVGHHRPAGAGRGRRARRHRLQDGSGAHRPLRAATPRRRALLRLPVRAGLRAPACGHPPHVPQHGDDHRGPPDRALHAFLPRRTEAVWQAISRACETGDFRPGTGRLCPSCAFKAWCPAFGGDPSPAALEAPVRYGAGAGAPVRRRRSTGSHRSFRLGVTPPEWLAPSGASSIAVRRFDDRSTTASNASVVIPSPTARSTARRRWATSPSSGTWSARAASPTAAGPTDTSGWRSGVESLAGQPGGQAPVPPDPPATVSGDERYPVRRPITSSFPSGHASAAFFAASLLSEGEPGLAGLWFALAASWGRRGPTCASPRVRRGGRRQRSAATLAAVAKRLCPRPGRGDRRE